MPRLSRWTPCGMLRLAGGPSHAENVYRAMVRSQGEAYASTGPQEARLYAQSMGLARARYALEHAGNQQFAHSAGDLFPVLEREHGIVPSAATTMAERRGEVAARDRLPSGASQTNISNALLDLLGDDFVAYRPTPYSEAARYPSSLGDQPMNLQPPEVVRKRVEILDTISLGLGAPQEVAYRNVAGGEAAEELEQVLSVGDVLVVDPSNNGLVERVTVTAVDVVSIGLGTFETRFTATFTKAHTAGALAYTMPYPMWTSTKRHSLVVLKQAAALDAEKRRKVHDLMRRIARGVSTWSIVAEAVAPGFTGPFVLDESYMDHTPFIAVTL